MEQKKVGNFLLTRVLGSGQFGTVFYAVRLDSPNSAFAVKCIPKSKLRLTPKLKQLFESEVAVMSSINHPNVIHLFELLETDNNYYMIMDYCNNGDLEQHLFKHGKLSETEAIYFLKQIMNGFLALHKEKVMHRDVKLSNIFLNDDRVLIGDFGFAKMGFEYTNTILGTPLTMAPELYNPGTPYTSKTDLWSLGICLYQLLFGEMPFSGKNMEMLKQDVRANSGDRLTFPFQSGISENCKGLLRSLLQSNPSRRIEWAAFFNHPVFDSPLPSPNTCGEMEERLSVLPTNNVNIVEYEFRRNREKKPDLTIHIEKNNDPLPEILMTKKVEDTSADSAEAIRILSDENRKYAHSVITARLLHEKKVITFHMFTARRLRNLTKFGLASKETMRILMTSLLLCIKKGMLMNQRMISSLTTKSNIYNQAEYFSFCSSEYAKTKALPSIMLDDKNYNQFFDQMRESFSSSSAYKHFCETLEGLPKSETEAITSVSNILIPYFNSLKLESEKLGSSGEYATDFATATLHLGIAIRSSAYFDFKTGINGFAWNEFEQNYGPKNAYTLLASLKI